MILAFLKALDPRVWIGLAIAIAIAAAFGYTYHAGWSSAHADHLLYMQQVQNAHAKNVADRKLREAKSETNIATLEARRVSDLSLVGSTWAAWVREHSGGLGAGAQPVPVTSQICNDPARDAELSAAVQRYLDAVGEARTGVAKLLEQADRQVRDLLIVQEWARKEQEINRSK